MQQSEITQHVCCTYGDRHWHNWCSWQARKCQTVTQQVAWITLFKWLHVLCCLLIGSPFVLCVWVAFWRQNLWSMKFKTHKWNIAITSKLIYGSCGTQMRTNSMQIAEVWRQKKQANVLSYALLRKLKMQIFKSLIPQNTKSLFEHLLQLYYSWSLGRISCLAELGLPLHSATVNIPFLLLHCRYK